jgi:formyltetrahydrofolate deformylase
MKGVVMRNTARLLIACPDARGIVAAVSGFIADHGGNLLDADQHTDADHGEFFMRVAVEREGFGLDRDTFAEAWEPVARRFTMQWNIFWGQPLKRMAILVSKQSHCMTDLLWRWRSGELDVEIPIIISNHPDIAPFARDANVPFEVCSVTQETKAEQERRVLRLLADARIDFVVLARYMQILSPAFVRQYPNRIINIHHSFLPAFAGGSPYKQAYQRGVKMIGATSHYVTDELDAGPIITQATASTSHRDTVDDLIRKGRDLERLVLARAVRLHVQDKILVSQNKTVVFE